MRKQHYKLGTHLYNLKNFEYLGTLTKIVITPGETRTTYYCTRNGGTHGWTITKFDLGVHIGSHRDWSRAVKDHKASIKAMRASLTISSTPTVNKFAG